MVLPFRPKYMSHHALFGPQVTLRSGRWKPFARALLGVSRVSEERYNETNRFPDTATAWGVGGGLDWQPFERIKIRIIQADYLRSKTYLGGETLRASFGIVIPFK